MFSLRGSRKRKTEQIIQKFLRSYAKNEKSQDKKDLKTWLILELQNELPNKKEEDIEKIATELISGIEIYYTKKKEVEKYQSLGITNGDYVGNEILEKVADEIEEAEIIDTKEVIEDMKEASNILSNYNEAMIYETAAIKEPQLVANILSTNSVNNYVDIINTAIDNANKATIESITTKAGTINQNPNLDGFIFEEYHAGTFNVDAAVKQKSYHAEALKPELGETYGKNSIDIVIENSGKYVKKYSAKAYKNANETAKSFYDKITGYKYKFQSKLVPTDQTKEIVNSVDKIKFDNVESKGITKTEIKNIQNELQSGNKKIDIFSFKKDVNTISISKQIGKQAMVNGTMGLGIGMVANIGANIITGKGVESEEVIEAGIKTGASMGMATAVAGGRFSGGMALATTIGLGTIGTVGTILTGGVALIGGAVCGVVGSKVGGAIANGIGTVAETIVDGAVDVIKAGKEVVKSLASGVWNGLKAAGNTVTSGASSVVSSIGSFFRGLFS